MSFWTLGRFWKEKTGETINVWKNILQFNLRVK
jgi:hypothetical protein